MSTIGRGAPGCSSSRLRSFATLAPHAATALYRAMSSRRRLPLVLVCALAACGKKDAVESAPAAAPSAKPSVAAAASTSAPKPAAATNPDKKIAPSKGPATAPAGFTAKSTRKGGAPIAYRFALAYRYEGSPVLHVELSTHQRGCTDVGADERELSAGESIVDLAIAPQVGKDAGVAVVQVAEQTATGTQSFVLGRRADVKVVAGDPMKDVQLVVSNGKALVDAEPVIDGTIIAWGCHVVPSPWAASDPKPIAQPGLTLELGGKKLPIQGAIHRVMRKEIVLSTHALSCTGEAEETEVRLTLSDAGDEVDVTGFAVTGPERAEPQKTPVKVTLQDFYFGRETDDVKLAGAFTVAGLQGKVQGSAKLLSCQ